MVHPFGSMFVGHHPLGGRGGGFLKKIEVEKEFDVCVDLTGGERVSDCLSSPPNFHNADYLFRAYKVVAELKCLEENKGKDVPRLVSPLRQPILKLQRGSACIRLYLWRLYFLRTKQPFFMVGGCVVSDQYRQSIAIVDVETLFPRHVEWRVLLCWVGCFS